MSLDLAVADTGIGFGNSRILHGIRLNAIDEAVEEVNGLNLTFWNPGENPDLVQRGIAIGLARTDAAQMTGISLGSVVGGGSADGINVGLLGVHADGALRGINVGSFLVWGGRELTGLNAGLLVAGGGDINGITLAPLTIHPQPVTDILEPHDGSIQGITLCGLLLDYPCVNGITGAGIIRARHERGLGVAWLLNDVRRTQTGLSLAPINLTRDLRGVQIGLLNYVDSNPHPFKLLPFLNAGWHSADS